VIQRGTVNLVTYLWLRGSPGCFRDREFNGRPFRSGGDHLPEGRVMVPRRQERISASTVASVCSA